MTEAELDSLFEKSLPVIDEALRYVFGSITPRVDRKERLVGYNEVSLMLDLSHDALAPDGRPVWTLGVESYDPGVRYHSDGSGTPPSWDFDDKGTFFDVRLAVGPFVSMVAQSRYDEFYQQKFMGPAESEL